MECPVAVRARFAQDVEREGRLRDHDEGEQCGRKGPSRPDPRALPDIDSFPQTDLDLQAPTSSPFAAPPSPDLVIAASSVGEHHGSHLGTGSDLVQEGQRACLALEHVADEAAQGVLGLELDLGRDAQPGDGLDVRGGDRP